MPGSNADKRLCEFVIEMIQACVDPSEPATLTRELQMSCVSFCSELPSSFAT
jgi:hypothetical protein